jgi:hypothetical protein
LMHFFARQRCFQFGGIAGIFVAHASPTCSRAAPIKDSHRIRPQL